MNHAKSVGMDTRRGMLGMTLIELMAVIMVIGVLGMIAIPSYRQYVMRAQRTEAKSFLLQVQTNQERFYLNSRRYGSVSDLQGTIPPLLSANASSERGIYQVTKALVGTVETRYTATASPVSGAGIDMTADAECATFSITAQGERTATGTGANCW